MSLSAWINMDDATSFPIIGKGVYNTSLEYVFAVNSSDKLEFYIADESVASCYTGRVYNTALTAYQGSWIHVAATYDGAGGGSARDTINLYLNGVLVDDTNMGGNESSYVAMENLAAVVEIGKNASTYANGKIADVRVYAEELTAAEVQVLASKINVNTSLGAGTTNLKAYWPIAGTSIDITDNSANSHNLTASGSPATVYDAFSVNVQDNSTTTDGTFTVTQGKVEGLALTQLNFDGTNDDVDIGAVERTADTTIAMWINADDMQQNRLIGDDGGSSHDYIRFKDNNNTQLRVAINNTTLDVTGLSAMPTGTWFHLIVSHDYSNGDIKVWQDGVNEFTGSGIGNNQAWTLNRIGGDTTDYHDGRLRDVRIYDYLLSDEQAASLYSGSYNVTPLHWWKMDDGGAHASGSATVEDYGTGTDADGTKSGAGWQNGTLNLDSSLTIAANGTFNGPRGTLQIDDDITGAGTFTLLTGSTFTLASGKTFTGTSTASQLTVDIPEDLDLEIVADVANLDCKSGTDMTVVGSVAGCSFEDSTANIRQWHHTLDTQQLLDADEAGDDDLRLTKPALDNALELMTK